MPVEADDAVPGRQLVLVVGGLGGRKEGAMLRPTVLTSTNAENQAAYESYKALDEPSRLALLGQGSA